MSRTDITDQRPSVSNPRSVAAGSFTRVSVATGLALVAVAGCRPQPPSARQVENWSQQPCPTTADSHITSPGRIEVQPVPTVAEPAEPPAVTRPFPAIDVDDTQPGDMPHELLSPADLDRLTSQIVTRQQLSRLLVLEAWLQHRVSELDQAEWNLLERSSQPSGCGIGWRERLANVRLHRGRTERDLDTLRTERLRCESSLKVGME